MYTPLSPNAPQSIAGLWSMQKLSGDLRCIARGSWGVQLCSLCFSLMSLHQENQFYILQLHVGNPITPKGDLNACHWLSTKNQWKHAMKNSAARPSFCLNVRFYVVSDSHLFGNMESTLSCGDALPLSKVEIVEKILHAFDVWPECMLCPKGVGFAEHVPAEKHLRALWEKLPLGKPVARGTQRGDIRDRFLISLPFGLTGNWTF